MSVQLSTHEVSEACGTIFVSQKHCVAPTWRSPAPAWHQDHFSTRRHHPINQITRFYRRCCNSQEYAALPSGGSFARKSTFQFVLPACPATNRVGEYSSECSSYSLWQGKKTGKEGREPGRSKAKQSEQRTHIEAKC